jgi:hypothetical protein
MTPLNPPVLLTLFLYDLYVKLLRLTDGFDGLGGLGGSRRK